MQFTIHDIRNIKRKHVCMYYEITMGHCYSKIAKFSLRCDYCCYITTLPTTFAFARLHYFTFPTSVLVVRTMAILNVAKELYLSVITNKRSLSPPPPCVRARGGGDSVLFLDYVHNDLFFVVMFLIYQLLQRFAGSLLCSGTMEPVR